MLGMTEERCVCDVSDEDGGGKSQSNAQLFRALTTAAVQRVNELHPEAGITIRR